MFEGSLLNRKEEEQPPRILMPGEIKQLIDRKEKAKAAAKFVEDSFASMGLDETDLDAALAELEKWHGSDVEN